MQTFVEIKKERDWIGRQIIHLQKRVVDPSDQWIFGKLGFVLIEKALEELQVRYVIADAAVHTHED